MYTYADKVKNVLHTQKVSKAKNISVAKNTLNSTYNEKKYAKILLHYRWLFVKGDVFIGVCSIFGVDIFLCYSRFFIKGNFVIGRVECI